MSDAKLVCCIVKWSIENVKPFPLQKHKTTRHKILWSPTVTSNAHFVQMLTGRILILSHLQSTSTRWSWQSRKTHSSGLACKGVKKPRALFRLWGPWPGWSDRNGLFFINVFPGTVIKQAVLRPVQWQTGILTDSLYKTTEGEKKNSPSLNTDYTSIKRIQNMCL